jgi:hypothetical protein
MRVYLAIAGLLLLVGCAGVQTPAVDTPRRELTSIEKAGISASVAATLKDPGSAQFKWVPVILTEREGISDYCGLVNSRNSYGGYGGFVRYYAQLIKDGKGQFTRAAVRDVEVPGREINIIDPRWLNGICEKFGYTDLATAQ